MRWLTTERGRPVVDAEGVRVGRVADLIAALDSGGQHPSVTGIVVGHRRPRSFELGDLARYDDDAITLAPDARLRSMEPDRGTITLDAGELLLCRDVLDTQVVDLDGHRVARVADLALDRRADGRLRVAGVDVGVGRILARFGVHRNGSMERFIDWDDLHLTSRRGHLAQLAAPRAAVHRLDAAGLAALVERLDVTSGSQVLAAVPPERAAAALEHGHHRTGERLLRALPVTTARDIVARLPHPRRHHWEAHLHRERPLRGRRFHRTKGWRRHRTPS
ncbi:MAG: magnesium transporter [Acidimicrobiia bacterium]|nr:magnesium transporter [Acidimicrobiia bacterium]